MPPLTTTHDDPVTETLDNDAFYGDIEAQEFQEAYRLPSSVAPDTFVRQLRLALDEVNEELAEWIERHVSTEARFCGNRPLFPNPRTGEVYSRNTIQNIWRNACKMAEVDHVPPYRATKHSTLSELAKVLSPQQLQGLARHKKFDTTRLYFSEDADPKGEAQVARAKLLEAQNQAANKRPTKNVSQLRDLTR